MTTNQDATAFAALFPRQDKPLSTTLGMTRIFEHESRRDSGRESLSTNQDATAFAALFRVRTSLEHESGHFAALFPRQDKPLTTNSKACPDGGRIRAIKKIRGQRPAAGK